MINMEDNEEQVDNKNIKIEPEIKEIVEKQEQITQEELQEIKKSIDEAFKNNLRI